MKNVINKTKEAVQEHSLKAAAVTTVALMTTPAFASIDVDTSVDFIKGLDTPIGKVGAAILGIATIIFGWKRLTSMVR